MPAEVYRELCKAMAKRGAEYRGMDIPEFYPMAEELFTPEEANVFLAIPRGYHPASAIATQMGRSEEEVAPILQRDQGGIELVDVDGNDVYVRFTGHCAGCAFSKLTQNSVVQDILRKRVLPNLTVKEA